MHPSASVRTWASNIFPANGPKQEPQLPKTYARRDKDVYADNFMHTHSQADSRFKAELEEMKEMKQKEITKHVIILKHHIKELKTA